MSIRERIRDRIDSWLRAYSFPLLVGIGLLYEKFLRIFPVLLLAGCFLAGWFFAGGMVEKSCLKYKQLAACKIIEGK